MKSFLVIIFLFFTYNFSYAATDLIFFLEAAHKNNPKLNAERKNFKATKENINISRSEFLPSVSVSGDIDSSQSTNKTDQSGSSIADSNLDTETKKISVDQKIFQGFQGYNSLKKSELETKKANFELREVEQSVIFDAASVYLDFIYKTKSKEFNLANVDLLERQVESDSARAQRGEITLTDLAQSESSLAGARADYIISETELLTTIANFERIITTSVPKEIEENFNLNINLPNNLDEALDLSEKNNPKLIIAKLEYEISKRKLNIEKGELSPSASINYSKSETTDLSSTVDKTDKESVKATITWPIIKGGKNYSSIKKQKLKKEQQNLILKDTRNEVNTNTANAWSLYQSSESVLKATQSQVKAAEIANEGITLEYDSGNNRTTLEVVQSRSLLLNARIAHAKAERDFVISKFRLLGEIGSLSLENIKKS